MIPAANDMLIYSCIAFFLFRTDRELRQPLGGTEPRSWSIAQSYGRCGGREVAQALLKTSFRSQSDEHRQGAMEWEPERPWTQRMMSDRLQDSLYPIL